LEKNVLLVSICVIAYSDVKEQHLSMLVCPVPKHHDCCT